MTKVNYHCHVNYCKHATGTVEELVSEGIRSGFTTLGISDHIPYKKDPFPFRMDFEELDSYFQDIETSKELHKDQIQILRGLESEYLTEYDYYYHWIAETKKPDYMILGQHMFIGKDQRLLDSFNLPGTNRFVEYAETVEKGLNTGLFKILAHPAFVALIAETWDDNCKRMTDILLNAAIKNDTILEFNANGIRKGIRHYESGDHYPYPNPYFFEEVKKTNLRVVVGSDSHAVEQLNDESFQFAFRYLKEFGITPVTSLS